MGGASEPDQKKRAGLLEFWRGLPVVIQAITGLIVAIGVTVAGISALLAAIGVVRPDQSPSPAPAANVVSPSPSLSPGTSPSPSPTATASASPSPTPTATPRADLVISELAVHTNAGYPVLVLLVSNRGSIQGQVTRLVFNAAQDPTCVNDGATLPQLNYDMLLPQLKGRFEVVLPQPYAVDPGDALPIALSVGIDRNNKDACTIKPKVRLRYVDVSGEKRLTPVWDEPISLKVRPLEKTTIKNPCLFIQCNPLPSGIKI